MNRALACMSIAVWIAGCAASLDEPERWEDPERCAIDVPQEIFAQRCALGGCHVPHSPTGGIEYLSADLGARLLGTESTTCHGRLLIDPSAPEESFLLERLSPDPHCGDEAIDRMPQIGAPLDEHELDCVAQWVEDIALGSEP